MEIEMLALCDAATEYSGKLNMLGAFDTINTRTLPATHPQCAVVLRIRFDRIEEGAHKLKLTFVDLDGKSILPNLDASFNVSFKEDQKSVVANLILNIQQLQFEKGGEFSIDLAIDGRREKSLPLFVNVAEQRN